MPSQIHNSKATLQSKSSALKRQAIRLRLGVPEKAFNHIDACLALKTGGTATPFTGPVTDKKFGFYIVGSGRSGNTLLRRLLMEKYFVYIPPELPGMGKTIRAFSKNHRSNWPDVVATVLNVFEQESNIDVANPENDSVYNLKKELNIDVKALEQKLLRYSQDQQNGSAVFSAIYNEIFFQEFGRDLADHDKYVIGDKTPWNTMYMETCTKIFPEAQFISMMRNPYAVCMSYVKSLSGVTGGTYVDAAHRWRVSVQRWLKFRQNYSSNAAMIVQYETLVENHAQILDDIGLSLNLPSRLGENQNVTSLLKDSNLVQHKKLTQPVDNASVNKWRGELPAREKSDIKSIVSRTVEKLYRDTGIDYRESH